MYTRVCAHIHTHTNTQNTATEYTPRKQEPSRPIYSSRNSVCIRTTHYLFDVLGSLKGLLSIHVYGFINRPIDFQNPVKCDTAGITKRNEYIDYGNKSYIVDLPIRKLQIEDIVTYWMLLIFKNHTRIRNYNYSFSVKEWNGNMALLQV